MSYIEKVYSMLTEEIKDSENYVKVNRALVKTFEKISMLIPEETELLKDLDTQSCGLEVEYGKMCFKEGVKLAFALAAECLT